MYQNKKGFKSKETFFINVDDCKDIIYFNITLHGIEYIFDKISDLKLKKEIIFDKNDFNNTYITGSTPVEQLSFHYCDDVKDKSIIANFSDKTSTLHLFSSEFGIEELKIRLLALRDSLQNNIIDDISYMIPEWGGNLLIYEQKINDTYIVCHLRLYGIM